MNRRQILMALLSGSAFSGMLHAGPRFGPATVGQVAAGLMLGSLRVGSRGTAVYRRRLTLDEAALPVALRLRLPGDQGSLYLADIIDHIFESGTLVAQDRSQLFSNLGALGPRPSFRPFRSWGRHLIDKWARLGEVNTLLSREHVESCGECTGYFRDFTQDTEIGEIPLWTDDTVEVRGTDNRVTSGVRPVSQLVLPQGPSLNAKSFMKGRELTFYLKVRKGAVVSIERLDDTLAPPGIADACQRQLKKMAWLNLDGVSGITVIFRWPN